MKIDEKVSQEVDMNYLTTEQKQLCHDIADIYGIEQVTVCIEELAELSQVLCKFLRCIKAGQPVRKGIAEITSNVTEEVADVFITIEQVCRVIGIMDMKVNKTIDEKLNRTLLLSKEQRQ